MVTFGKKTLVVDFRSGPGRLDHRFRWKESFFAIWLAGLAAAAGAAALASGGGARADAVAGAAVGALLVGCGLYLYFNNKVFGPAERWKERVESREGLRTAPGDAGIFTPIASAVADRYEEALARLEEVLKGREERLREVETLQRHLEEAKSHLESKIQDLHSIYEVSTAIAATLDVEELFRIIPERVREILGLKDFCLLLYDPESRTLRCRASAGMPADVAAEFSIRPGEGISGRVFETGQPVYVPDVRLSPDFLYYGGRRSDVRSFMSVPLMSKGRAVGVLNVNHPEPNALDAESMATLRVLAAHIAIAIENAELFQFVKSLAAKDSLTLLYNHGAFHQRLQVELERAARYARPISVIMLDLDRFKEVNDTYGHLVGDRILVITGSVLSAHLRQSDVPARYGGDEFAVILPETDLVAASSIASRIAGGISQVRVETEKGQTISITASIGYATCPVDCKDRRRILEVADRLMYESKRQGPGGILGEQLP